jgi:putative ABC transport system permease protein
LQIVGATSDLFSCLGVSLLRGGLWREGVSGPVPEVVLGQHLARRMFDEADPLGRTVHLVWRSEAGSSSSGDVRIVGVADDRAIAGDEALVVYVPLDGYPASEIAFLARSEQATPIAVAATLRRAIDSVRPGVAVSFAGRAQGLRARPFLVLRMLALAAASLAVVALAIAVVGIYAAVSQHVLTRQHEIGVRLALGATRRDIIVSVMWDALRPVACGIAAGFGLAVLGRASLQPLMVRFVEAIDAESVVVVVISVLAAAIGACWFPARHASRVDPVETLRSY